jgi:5'-3' exoribonuclease 1
LAEADLNNQIYTPSWKVAKMLGLSGLALSKITSSFYVMLEKDKKLNLGLNLKYESKQEKVLGFADKTEHGWEYSDKAINLIRNYMERFPSIFKGLRKPSIDNYYSSKELFNSTHPDNDANDASKWLKEQGVNDFLRVPLSSRSLTTNAIQNISKGLMEYTNKLKEEEKEIICINGVPRTVLLFLI